MTTNYVKTLITDEATDNDSYITETLMQSLAQSVNYVIDVCTNDGTNSENLTVTSINPASMDMFVSSWVLINNTPASNNFAHGLGRTPTVVLPFVSSNSNGLPMFMLGGMDDTDFGGSIASVTAIDGTNVTVNNAGGGPGYFKVVCW